MLKFKKKIEKNYHKMIIGSNNIFKTKIRRNIFNLIRKNPGINFNELEKKLKLGSNQALWHLNLLEQSKIIKYIKIGNQKAYFLYSFDPSYCNLFFYLKKEKINKFIQLFVNNNAQSGLKPTIISKSLNMHYNTTKKYLKILSDLGIIIPEKIEKKIIYFFDFDNYNRLSQIIQNHFKEVRKEIVHEFVLAF
ncbi:MAG: winged helix-turn-helix transcriptional regulator [archaeon]|nr:winged helix-turn-helix transcriptional regulator [archaeon]